MFNIISANIVLLVIFSSGVEFSTQTNDSKILTWYFKIPTILKVAQP